MKYTLADFSKQFRNDDDCLEFIFNRRYGKLFICPSCGKSDQFTRVTTRKCYSCSCGYQIHPTAGTVFHKSPTKLRDWFIVIYLMTQSRNGVSAKEIQRHLGVTYKCAWRLASKVRELMAQAPSMLIDTVEVDETYIGGKGDGTRGRGAKKKTAVVGMVQRKGTVKAKAVPNVKSSTVMPLIKNNVRIGAKIMTDEFNIYNKVGQNGYSHATIAHKDYKYVINEVHTNTIEGFWSQVKRSISGTHHSVSPKHLQKYLDEFVFRYNARNALESIFQLALAKV